MSRLLDSILVIDVSVTCWAGDPPPGQQSEILEIGICRVDIRSARVQETHSLVIVPETSLVSAYCSRVTKIEARDLDRGLTFATACRALAREYGAGHRAWASYGNHVRRIIKNQCANRSISYPFGATHINLKSLIAILKAQPEERSLPDTMLELNLPLTGARHRAADRAYNAALILSRLLMEHRMKLLGGTN